jgi:hypothetical protein
MTYYEIEGCPDLLFGTREDAEQHRDYLCMTYCATPDHGWAITKRPDEYVDPNNDGFASI